MSTDLRTNPGSAAVDPITLEVTHEARSLRAAVDGERLLQVLANLLSNAIKFSPPRAPIVVSLALSGRRARISVRDHGPGVPESFQPYLFDKFTQAASGTTRLKGGSGLGLAIVRKLVTRMGGKVGYEAAQDGGALFFIELTTNSTSEIAANPAHDLPPPSDSIVWTE